jgi:hypothetical protein
MTVSLRTIFKYRASSEYGLADRWHAFSDCWQITGNHCVAVINNTGPERPLCWSCVQRLMSEHPS